MNTVYGLLIPALWLAWSVYWMIAARANKRVIRRESVASRFGHFGPIALASALLWLPPGLFRGWLGERMLPATWASFWSGAALLAAGLLFTVWARRELGRNWSGTVTLKENHELIRSGPYRHVRHPIYTGLLLGFFGSALAGDEWRGMIAVLIVFAALWRKLKLEERWLGELFGAAYAQYRREVKALVPYLL